MEQRPWSGGSSTSRKQQPAARSTPPIAPAVPRPIGCASPPNAPPALQCDQEDRAAPAHACSTCRRLTATAACPAQTFGLPTFPCPIQAVFAFLQPGNDSHQFSWSATRLWAPRSSVHGTQLMLWEWMGARRTPE